MNWLRKRIHNVDLDEKYKCLKNTVNRNIALEKKNYYSRLIHNSCNKNRTLWNIVKSNNGNNLKNKTIEKISINEVTYAEPTTIANAFGVYLSTVVENKMSLHFPNLSNTCTTMPNVASSMFFSPVISNDIINIIKNLPNKKSTGPDEIPVSLIKANADIIAPVLSELITASVEKGVFPSALKLASVILVLKKGDPLDAENYRPIALLSIFSKIMEKAIAIQIESYLNKNNILTNCQFGFRAGFSTERATSECVQHIYDRADNGMLVAAVFFDLSRAFDTVTCKFVAAKLHSIGIRGCINACLTSFLEARRFFVKIEEARSDEFDADHGTPQGSVLGPLIFLLFINDLPQYISEGTPFLYADDTCIIISADHVELLQHKIQVVIKEFDDWCYKNRLIINFNKTVTMEFHTKLKPPTNINFNFHGALIKPSASTKFLGIFLDSHLSWDDHINAVCLKLSKGYYLINSLKHSLDTDGLVNVYYATAHSAISYCIVLWGQAKDVQRVFILQKRIMRLIFKIPYKSSCREAFKRHRILTVTSIYILKTLVYFFQNKHKVKKHSDEHKYNTRNKDSFVTNKFYHIYYKKSPAYAGCFLFNLLPYNMRELTSLSAFKGKLKDILLKGCFYSVEEFIDTLRPHI
nr:unnamed protein product [Callosobruchus chinensis]